LFVLRVGPSDRAGRRRRTRATLAFALLLAACGGDDGAPPIDADPTPAGSCIRPGDHGNSLGVGEYCSPGGGQCASFDRAPLCLADVGQDQWFCTRIGCDATTDCGTGAGCLLETDGSACVPCRCDSRGLGCPQP
jgi:hypothetical protein